MQVSGARGLNFATDSNILQDAIDREEFEQATCDICRFFIVSLRLYYALIGSSHFVQVAEGVRNRHRVFLEDDGWQNAARSQNLEGIAGIEGRLIDIL